MADPMAEVAPLPAESTTHLNRRESYDYREYRKQLHWWLLHFGKDPERGEGYAEATVRVRAYLIDQFYRWVWEQEGTYTTWVSHEHANDWVDVLVASEKGNANKNSSLKAVRTLFKYQHHIHGTDKWSPPFRFYEKGNQPRDYLTKKERRIIRDASLAYGSVPAYHSLSPDARDRWKQYLSQRFEKPKAEVELADWERANSWKVPSLVWVSMDAGLRPIEVERSVIRWVDLDNGVLRIPKEQSTKNTENWTVALRPRTTQYLRKWLQERSTYDLYEGSDSIWFTRKGNPYQSASLRYLLHRLCDISGIEYEDHQMSWYTIRHSVGTYMTREEDLAATAAQMRHKSILSTMQYDQAPVEDRRKALERMG